jgi:polyhydroxybutyrate depolymerase
VIGLRGANSDGPKLAGLTHFNDVADTAGSIVVYPDALQWRLEYHGHAAPQDDIAFVAAVIARVSTSYPVNPHQVYALGFSEGAELAEELGCSLSTQIAAVASVAGHMPSTYPCTPIHPMPYLTIHGTADPIWSLCRLGEPEGWQASHGRR